MNSVKKLVHRCWKGFVTLRRLPNSATTVERRKPTHAAFPYSPPKVRLQFVYRIVQDRQAASVFGLHLDNVYSYAIISTTYYLLLMCTTFNYRAYGFCHSGQGMEHWIPNKVEDGSNVR